MRPSARRPADEASEEASYVRLAGAWRRVHRTDSAAGAHRGLKVGVAVVTFVLLLPVVGMVLVFAVLPALPLALVVGTALGPMNLFPNGEDEDEDEAYALWQQRRAGALPFM